MTKKDLIISESAEQWDEIRTEARPFTPDYLPVVCIDNKVSNLYYNGEHGSLGSLSFVSAEILYDVMTGKNTKYVD